MAYNNQNRNKKQQKQGPNGSYVEVRDNNVGQAMRRLKKILNTEGVFKEMRDRRFFKKPSVKRKEAAAAAKKRWQKKLADRQW